MPNTSSTLRLDPTTQLRLRQPKLNSSGSVLLKTPEGIWDCVECKEWTEVRYTEEGWVDRYSALHGAIDEEEAKKITDENTDESRFTYKNRLRSPTTLARIDANHSKLLQTTEPLTFKFVHSKWDPNDGTLELFITRDITTSKDDIAGTEYTSLLLFFEPVVFEQEEEEVVGLKRAKSDAI